MKVSAQGAATDFDFEEDLADDEMSLVCEGEERERWREIVCMRERGGGESVRKNRVKRRVPQREIRRKRMALLCDCVFVRVKCTRKSTWVRWCVCVLLSCREWKWL